MKIRKVISDWSSVISDDALAVYTANMSVFRHHNKPSISFNRWKERSTLSPIEIFENYEIIDDPGKLFELYKNFYNEAIKSGITPKVFPDARETFMHLREKGIKLSILSSHPEENLLKEMKDYDLEGIFDFVMGNTKDKVKGLIHICNCFDEKPEFILF
jgi:phosphoglycolate phosphatase-like HAD superfamily hydrolase